MTTTTTTTTTTTLPLAQLESLRFKSAQIIEALTALQRTLDGPLAVLPPWPDVLAKYTVLLSQTHHFSTTLCAAIATSTHNSTSSATGTAGAGPRLANIALHPSTPLADAPLGALLPLLRNQQTSDVLRAESLCVRRVARALGVVGAGPAEALEACAGARRAHDQRAERAARAVAMLRERFEWRQRVEVEVEEPEELEWDPRVVAGPIDVDADAEGEGEGEGEAEGEADGGMESGEGQSSDEDEVEGELVALREGEDGGTPGGVAGGAFAPIDANGMAVG